VLAAIRRAGQPSFSAQVVRPFDESRPLTTTAHLAANASGAAIVTWGEATDESSRDFVSKAAWRPPGGSFGTPETVSAHAGGTAPVVAADGTATLLGIPGESQQPAQDGLGSLERHPGGGYGGYQEATELGWEQDPELSSDSAGNLFAAWRRYYDRSSDGSAGSGPFGTAYALVRPAGGKFPIPETAVSDDGRNVWDMALDAGAGGHAISAWPRGTFPDDFHIELSEHGGAPSLDGSGGGGPSGPPTSATPAGDPGGSASGPTMRPAASPAMAPTGHPRPHRRHRCKRRGARHHRDHHTRRRHRACHRR
jgi:hypothetical protein